MWISKAEYPIKTNLPKITQHEHLPKGAVELARIPDTLNSKYDVWLFVKNNGGLSLLNVASRTLKDGTPFYCCAQSDFPMEFLPWFSNALTEFQKPPSEGGLHAGAMTSADEDVGGEMLCIQRAMGAGRGRGGYAVLNRSRCEEGYDLQTEFTPHRISWADSFLYEGGLLDLIIELAEKYRNGTL